MESSKLLKTVRIVIVLSLFIYLLGYIIGSIYKK